MIILSIYTGAFIGEAVRAGINTVAVGQVEAARAIGLTFTQVLGLVVLPQALRSVVQPVGSLFSALVRNTSLAYAISVVELTGTADRIGNETAEYLPAFLGALSPHADLRADVAFNSRPLGGCSGLAQKTVLLLQCASARTVGVALVYLTGTGSPRADAAM